MPSNYVFKPTAEQALRSMLSAARRRLNTALDIMDTFRRILREFWFPALIAVAWTAYNLWASSKPVDVRAIINIFTPSFFLASWATGQFFRIQKQAKVERNLSAIEGRLGSVVEKIEKHTKDFVGFATGGSSIATFMPMFYEKDKLELALYNESEYPVFDVYTELIDLAEKIDPVAGKFWTRHRFMINSLYPHRMVKEAYKMDVSGLEALSLNIFIQTRGVGATQCLRLRRVAGRMQIAIKVSLNDGEVKYNIPPEFPGYDPGDPAALFN